jgi:hypothetical protein
MTGRSPQLRTNDGIELWNPVHRAASVTNHEEDGLLLKNNLTAESPKTQTARHFVA